MARISKEQVRQEKGTRTRREVLRRLCSGAVAMPLLPSISALAITESDENRPRIRLVDGVSGCARGAGREPKPTSSSADTVAATLPVRTSPT